MRNINRRYSFQPKNIVLSHIERNLKEYIIASIIFITGLLLGVYFFNHLNDAQISSIIEYLNNSINAIKEQNVINKTQMLMANIKQDIFIVGLIWIMGSTIIGLLIVYLILCFKGFCLGYTISSVVYTLRNK